MSAKKNYNERFFKIVNYIGLLTLWQNSLIHLVFSKFEIINGRLRECHNKIK